MKAYKPSVVYINTTIVLRHNYQYFSLHYVLPQSNYDSITFLVCGYTVYEIRCKRIYSYWSMKAYRPSVVCINTTIVLRHKYWYFPLHYVFTHCKYDPLSFLVCGCTVEEIRCKGIYAYWSMKAYRPSVVCINTTIVLGHIYRYFRL